MFRWDCGVCCGITSLTLPPPHPLRHDAVVGYGGSEVRSYHGSMPGLDHPLSTHSSLHRLDGQSARGSQRDAAEAPPPLVTHGAAATDSPPPGDNGTSA